MRRSQTAWSGRPVQEAEPDSEACGLGRSRRFWSGHGAVPWTGASENRDPNQVGRALWSSQGVAQRQGGESVDLQAGWGLLQDLRQLLELLDLSGSMGRTSFPAERALSESGGRQGLGVSVNRGRYEAESGALAGTEGKTGAGTGDTAGTGSKVESGRRAETEDAAAAAAAAG